MILVPQKRQNNQLVLPKFSRSSEINSDIQV